MPSAPIVRRRPRNRISVSLPMFRRQTKSNASSDALSSSSNSMTVLSDSPVLSPTTFTTFSSSRTTTKSNTTSSRRVDDVSPVSTPTSRTTTPTTTSFPLTPTTVVFKPLSSRASSFHDNHSCSTSNNSFNSSTASLTTTVGGTDSWLEDWAQATIAATWRGYKQKKTYHRLRRRYRRARQSRNMHRLKRPRVKTVQTADTADTADTVEREESVSNTRTAIQTLTKLKRQNIDNAAAVVVQSTYRRKKAYTQTKRMKKEARQQRKKLQKLQFKSATIIQALTRGRSSRRRTARQMRQQRIKQHQRQIRQRTKRRKAANNVQRIFRGYQCRAQLIHLMKKIQQAKEEQDNIIKLRQNNEKVKKRELRQKKREEKRKREESKRQNEWSKLEQEHDAQRKNQQQRAETRATHLAKRKEQERAGGRNQEKKQEDRETKNNKRKQLDDGGQPQQNTKQEHAQQQQRVRSAEKPPQLPQQKPAQQTIHQQKIHQQKPQQPTQPNWQEQQRLRKEQAREQKEAVAAAAAKKQAIAMQRKKSRRHSSDVSTKKQQVQTTPESEMQTDLTGLWTGEVCDSNSNVTQITDCVLRFYNDPENGQSMIEGRSKTTSGTSGNGLLVFQGVWDFNSSRFILVLENSIGKTTFMGWMKQRRPESAKMVIKAMGKEKARGVGHTLEGNAATGHIQLRKRENTRRAGITNIKKLINQAKDHGIMKRGNAAGRSSTNADRRAPSNKHKNHKNSRKSNKRNPSHSSTHSQRSQSSDRSQQPPENQNYRRTVTTNHDMAGEAPMKRLTLRFGTLQASIRAQLNGAKQHMRELAGPLGQTAPEHMSKMSKDVKKMMDRSNAMGRQLKALETQLSLFGYSGVEENEDYLMCFDGPRQGDASEQQHNQRQNNKDDEENDTECPASPLPMSSPKRRPIPLIASSVFEKLQSDFLPSSAVGRQRGSSRASSRASSRGSSMGSRSSSRESIRSSRSRGHTPIASKRLAKFFSAATSGAEANNARPGRKSAFQFNATTMVKSGRNKTMLASLTLKSKRTTSQPSLRSLERIVLVPTPRAKEKHLHRRRRVQKGLQLDPMKE